MTNKYKLNEDEIDINSSDEEVAGENLPGLEQKYQEQMRQIVTQKLDLSVSTLPAMLKEQIKLNPDFQRRDRWDQERRSRFIESLFMNVPVPPVFLGENEYGSYVVLDGRQRLTAVKYFLSNQLILKKLKVWDSLNDMKFDDLFRRGWDKHFTRRFIPAVVILKESSAAVKYDVFDRLNTGGVQANEMEIRNAVYRGKFTDLLHKLSRSKEFCQLWRIPVDRIKAEENNIYKEMSDLSLVLRFFALSEYEGMNMAFKDYLSDFMDARNKAYEKSPDIKQNDKKRFMNAAKNCWRIFGSSAFQKPAGKNGKPQRLFPLADAVMVALADYPPESISEDKAEKIKAAVGSLFQDADFTKAIGTGTNGKNAIATRINKAKQAVNESLT